MPNKFNYNRWITFLAIAIFILRIKPHVLAIYSSTKVTILYTAIALKDTPNTVSAYGSFHYPNYKEKNIIRYRLL